MGAMPGSLYIDTRFTESRGEGPIRSLRTVCCQLVERASTDGSLDCWYKEDKLPQALGARGRTWSGISLEEMTEAETVELSALRCSSGYDATRSCFTYRKEVKELLRGGFEQDANFRDYDLKTSFPRAFAARHPEAACVRSWVDGSFDLRGMPRDVAFINQCFGVGQKGIRDWCRAHGFSELPATSRRSKGAAGRMSQAMRPRYKRCRGAGAVGAKMFRTPSSTHSTVPTSEDSWKLPRSGSEAWRRFAAGSWTASSWKGTTQRRGLRWRRRWARTSRTNRIAAAASCFRVS